MAMQDFRSKKSEPTVYDFNGFPVSDGNHRYEIILRFKEGKARGLYIRFPDNGAFDWYEGMPLEHMVDQKKVRQYTEALGRLLLSAQHPSDK